MDLIRSALATVALVAVPAYAQEPHVPEQAAPETEERSVAATNALDDIDPAVSSAVLTADISPRPAGSGVMDELDLSRTEIIGNQELPKVLYIVPWRRSDPGELTGKPVNTLLDEVLAPVDRTEFLRQVDYYGDLHGDEPQQTER